MRDQTVAFPKREHTLSYKYVKRLKNFLWPIGAWPGEDFGEKVPVLVKCHRYFLPANTIFSTIGQIIFIRKYYKEMDFDQKGYTYLLLFITFLNFFRVCLPMFKTYGGIVKTFFESFHLGHSKHKGKFNQQVFETVENVSNVFTLYMIVLTYIGITLFCLCPTYLNYKNGIYSGYPTENATFHGIVGITYPKLVDTHDFSILSTIYSIYLTYPCSVSVCGIDLLLSLMAFQIVGHIIILRNDLENIYEQGAHSATATVSRKSISKDDENGVIGVIQMFSDEENKVIQEKLVTCINYHKMIVTFTEDLSEFFGPVLGVNYGFHLISCCLLLVECSVGTVDAIIQFGPITAIIFGQLIMLSVIFEIVSTVSEKLKDSVYFTPWEYMDIRNRRTIYLMLMRMQSPINVTAMGLTNVGVNAMAQILKATISYYTLLRSVNQ